MKSAVKTSSHAMWISFENGEFRILRLVMSKSHAVTQLDEALRYKSEGREFDSGWGYWNFSST